GIDRFARDAGRGFIGSLGPLSIVEARLVQSDLAPLLAGGMTKDPPVQADATGSWSFGSDLDPVVVDRSGCGNPAIALGFAFTDQICGRLLDGRGGFEIPDRIVTE